MGFSSRAHCPLSFRLSVVASNTANEHATYVWLYADNWEWTLLKDGGFWCEFIETLAFVFGKYLTLEPVL
jgi:hypothetical protein